MIPKALQIDSSCLNLGSSSTSLMKPTPYLPAKLHRMGQMVRLNLAMLSWHGRRLRRVIERGDHIVSRFWVCVCDLVAVCILLTRSLLPPSACLICPRRSGILAVTHTLSSLLYDRDQKLIKRVSYICMYRTAGLDDRIDTNTASVQTTV